MPTPLDTINFSISGTGVHTINLGSVLPTITDQVIINATTESDYAVTPLIVLNGLERLLMDFDCTVAVVVRRFEGSRSSASP